MLILPIKRKWFDMIAQEEKKEEYREIKKYWTKRLGNYFINHTLDSNTKKVLRKMTTTEKEVIFRNGYSKASPSVTCTCKLKIRTRQRRMGSREAEKSITY